MSPKVRFLKPRSNPIDLEWMENQQSYVQKELDNLNQLIPKLYSIIQDLETNLEMLRHTSNAISLHEYKKITKEILDKSKNCTILEVSKAKYEKDIKDLKTITQRPLGILIEGKFPKKRSRFGRKAK